MDLDIISPLPLGAWTHLVALQCAIIFNKAFLRGNAEASQTNKALTSQKCHPCCPWISLPSISDERSKCQQLQEKNHKSTDGVFMLLKIFQLNWSINIYYKNDDDELICCCSSHEFAANKNLLAD